MYLDAIINNTKDVETISFYATQCENPLFKNLLYGLVGAYSID